MIKFYSLTTDLTCMSASLQHIGKIVHLLFLNSGSLKVTIKTSSSEQDIWLQQGDKGDKWNRGRAQISPQTNNYQVLLRYQLIPDEN